MKTGRIFLAAAALLFLTHAPGFAGQPEKTEGADKAAKAERAAIQQQVWKAYLSPAEQAALTAFAAEEQEVDESMAPGGDPAKLVEALRKGFEQYIAQSIPPLASVESSAFAENGVKGLWFKPKNASADKVLLYFHGGGYVIGSPMTGSAVAGFLAEQAKIVCFSLDYPLAPEAPFPAAPDNALAAYQMLLGKGFKPGNIVLAGDSAGGGLALVTLLNIRDKALPMPAGAYLLSPWTDLNNNTASYKLKQTVEKDMTPEFVQMLASMYVGKNDPNNPLISPAFADLRGLPPLLIHVGSHEILLDDSFIVARNAALGDVPVTLSVWPGYSHVFQMGYAQLEGGRKALIDGAAFFNAVLGNSLLRPAGAK